LVFNLNHPLIIDSIVFAPVCVKVLVIRLYNGADRADSHHLLLSLSVSYPQVAANKVIFNLAPVDHQVDLDYLLPEFQTPLWYQVIEHDRWKIEFHHFEVAQVVEQMVELDHAKVYQGHIETIFEGFCQTWGNAIRKFVIIVIPIKSQILLVLVKLFELIVATVDVLDLGLKLVTSIPVLDGLLLTRTSLCKCDYFVSLFIEVDQSLLTFIAFPYDVVAI
jgi:hypothetical protein